MSDDVRLGLVGLGRVAERGYLPALRVARGLKLTAVADSDPARAAPNGVARFGSAAELLAAGAVDAIVLATPVSEHLAGAGLAAEAGVTTLVEKPPAPDAASAERLVALDPPPWIGFNRRFSPWIPGLRDRLRSVECVELELELHARRSAWGRVTPGDDALLDLGPHLIDLARSLTASEVERVTSAEISHDRARVSLELGRCRALVVCAEDKPYRERLVARTATGGRLVCGTSLLRRLRDLARQSAFVASFAAELEALARAARGDDPGPLATAADGLAVMRVIDAARHSAAAGGEPMVVG